MLNLPPPSKQKLPPRRQPKQGRETETPDLHTLRSWSLLSSRNAFTQKRVLQLLSKLQFRECPAAYRLRNMIERLWCRLKDWRRIATRYDKLAANYLSGALIAASIIYLV